MLSRETEQKLVEIFITLSIGEEKINKLKQNIISNYSINPIQIFFKLDINNVGYLSQSDFFPFLKFFSVNFYPTDIDYIFYFYDKDEDNILRFNEFLDLIISDSNYFYKKSFRKKYRKNRFDLDELNGNCGPGIEKKIIEILLEEIDLARNLNDLIVNIKQRKDFVIQNVFYEIKSYSYITSDSLKAFFDRNEIDYNDKFIKNIFNRLSNKEKNCKISFNKFKSLFDIPFNKNMMTQMQNQIPFNLSQTYASNDIKFTSSENNNKFFTSNNSNIHRNQFNNKNEFYINIKNENYINEEDIQFECNHLSRSG
jgi:Ca2+-binding EF-hand superfamily protein